MNIIDHPNMNCDMICIVCLIIIMYIYLLCTHRLFIVFVICVFALHDDNLAFSSRRNITYKKITLPG